MDTKQYKVLRPIASPSIMRVEAGSIVDLDDASAAAFGESVELIVAAPVETPAASTEEQAPAETATTEEAPATDTSSETAPAETQEPSGTDTVATEGQSSEETTVAPEGDVSGAAQ